MKLGSDDEAAVQSPQIKKDKKKKDKKNKKKKDKKDKNELPSNLDTTALNHMSNEQIA